MNVNELYRTAKHLADQTMMMRDWISDRMEVNHPLKGNVPFNLETHQMDMLYRLLESKFNIFAKARQLGVTSLMLAYSIHESIYNSNHVTFIVVNSSTSVHSIGDRLRGMIAKGISPNDIVSMGRGEVRFSSGSIIRIVPPDITMMKSWTIDHLIFDEACFYNFYDIFMDLKWGVASHGRVTIYSTPSMKTNQNNQFIGLYTNFDWNSHTYTWKCNKNWDDNWYNSQVKLVGQDIVDTEYNCKFK